MGRFIMLVGALALAMCNLPPPTPPTPPPVDGLDAASPTPAPDAAPTVLDAAPGPSDACRRSYEHLVFIHCTPSEPSVGTWVDVCRNGRKHGAFRLDGIDRATTPDEARRAGVDCMP
jgi:hypothetical protein